MSYRPRRATGRFDLTRFLTDLHRVRVERGLTNTDVVIAVGMNPAHLSQMATKGTVPSADALAAYCTWAGLDANAYFVAARAAT